MSALWTSSSRFGTVARHLDVTSMRGIINCLAQGFSSPHLFAMPWTWQCLVCNTSYPLSGTKICFDDGVRLSAGNMDRTRLVPPEEYDLNEHWVTGALELPESSRQNCFLDCPFPGFCRLYELLVDEEECPHRSDMLIAGIEDS